MLNFFKNKKILITGNTGFKGSWLSEILIGAGAEVFGYALSQENKINLFSILGLRDKMECKFADVRDYEELKRYVLRVKPDIVFHLAAQPLVNLSYKEPRYTYDVNVMGTVNVLQAAFESDSCKSLLNVTTDKVYKNNEWVWGYRENEELNGYDPYSNSKSCSELVTHSYRRSIIKNAFPVSTARAGNVIGGGDFAEDRIVPDCIRAIEKGGCVELRNPNSIRPYQHVLEPLFAYLLIAKKQMEDFKFAGEYNIGPELKDCVSTLKIATLLKEFSDNKFDIKITNNAEFHEANFLKLDCSKADAVLGWRPRIDIAKACKMVVDWTNHYYDKENVCEYTLKQIDDYAKLFNAGVVKDGKNE